MNKVNNNVLGISILLISFVLSCTAVKVSGDEVIPLPSGSSTSTYSCGFSGTANGSTSDGRLLLDADFGTAYASKVFSIQVFNASSGDVVGALYPSTILNSAVTDSKGRICKTIYAIDTNGCANSLSYKNFVNGSYTVYFKLETSVGYTISTCATGQNQGTLTATWDKGFKQTIVVNDDTRIKVTNADLSTPVSANINLSNLNLFGTGTCNSDQIACIYSDNNNGTYDSNLNNRIDYDAVTLTGGNYTGVFNTKVLMQGTYSVQCFCDDNANSTLFETGETRCGGTGANVTGATPNVTITNSSCGVTP